MASGSGASKTSARRSAALRKLAIEETTTFPAVASHLPLMRGAPEISMFPPDNWQPKSASQLVIYGNEETAAVITYQVGKGQVIWWGNSAPVDQRQAFANPAIFRCF